MHKYAMTSKEIFRGQLFVIIGLFAVVGCSIGSEKGSAVASEIEATAPILLVEERTADIPESPGSGKEKRLDSARPAAVPRQAVPRAA